MADWFVIGGRWTGLLAGISDDAWQLRDKYAELGAEDDAMLITPELFDQFLASYEGKVPRRNGTVVHGSAGRRH